MGTSDRTGRRRDRRGRGLRGPLGPPGLPVMRSRADAFDDLVADAVEDLAERVRTAGLGDLRHVQVRVHEVPEDLGPAVTVAPLGRSSATEVPASLVVYRRPIEARSRPGRDRAELVREVVLEQLASLLGVDPDRIDPRQ